jgi:hypothetical protein
MSPQGRTSDDGGQRWCTQGSLPGAYKAGRSWRIPADALVTAGLETSLETDELGAQLSAAQAPVEHLLAELGDAVQRKQRPVVEREWNHVAARATRLASASRKLAELAAEAHRRFER